MPKDEVSKRAPFPLYRAGDKYVPGTLVKPIDDDGRAHLIGDIRTAELRIIPLTQELKRIKHEIDAEQKKLIQPVEEIQNMYEGNPPVKRTTLGAQHLILLGAMIKGSEAHRVRAKKLDSLSVSPDTRKFFDLLEFSSFGGADLKIGDVSLMEIVKPDKNHPPSVASIFKYCMEAVIMQQRRHPRDYVEGTGSSLARQYPNVATDKLANVSVAFLDIFNAFDQSELGKVYAKYPEYKPYTKGIKDRMDDFSKTLKEVLFNPEHEAFQDIRELVDHYFGIDNGMRFLTVYFLIQGGQSLQEIYRRAKRLETNSQHGNFYKKLSDEVLEFAELSQSVTDIRLFDDIETIFIPQQSNTDQPPDLDTISRFVLTDIFSKTSKRDYVVDSSDVDWGDIVVPDAFEITFDSKSPSVFKIKLSYRSEEEDMDVQWSIDTKKREFGWNFLESPNDERMQAFAGALRSVTFSILKNIYTQAQAIKTAKDTRGRMVHVPTTRIKGERPEQAQEDVSRKRKRRPEENISLAELFADSTPVESRTARSIVLPEDITIPAGAEERIRSKIDEFNNTGAGTLSPLASDRTLYKFRVGGVRVLLRREEDTYTVVEVGDRRDIYKKLPRKNI